MIHTANGHQLDLFEDVVVRENWIAQLESGISGNRAPAKKVAGLFAGIGGFELGLSRAGHETLLLCENDPGANAVLDAHFPSIRRHDDVRRLTKLPAETDLIAAGFPCQDLSQAGKTAGITGKNSGLIGYVFDLLRQRPVPWLLLENVPFMLQLAKGRALAVIVDELERLGTGGLTASSIREHSGFLRDASGYFCWLLSKKTLARCFSRTTLDLASISITKPLRPVASTGQKGFEGSAGPWTPFRLSRADLPWGFPLPPRS